MVEFYKKARKYLSLEDTKEVLYKVEGVMANKKNDPRTIPDSSKRQDKE